MDGNRRWAKQQGLPTFHGHKIGKDTLKTIVRHAMERGISYLTMWALSTDNVKKRSEQELAYLYALLDRTPEHLEEFLTNNGRFRTIGDLSVFPEKTRGVLEQTQEQSKDNSGLTLTVALNYGSLDEITRAVRSALRQCCDPETFSEEQFENLLDTAGLPPVDLHLRTGNRNRLSGYLLWQSAYAEIYFSEMLWPDFTTEELDKAISWFEEQQRTFGG